MEHIYTLDYEFGKGNQHRFIKYRISGKELDKVLRNWMEDEYEENKLYYYFYINRETRDYIYREYYWYAYNKYKKSIDNDEEEW